MSIHTEWMDAASCGVRYLTEQELAETHPVDEQASDDLVLLVGNGDTATVFTGTTEQLRQLAQAMLAALDTAAAPAQPHHD